MAPTTKKDEARQTDRRDSVFQHSGNEPHRSQDLSNSAPPATHVAVQTTAAVDATADDTAESELSSLVESIAMIAKPPKEIPWYEQPSGPTASELLMDKRRTSVTRAPTTPSPLRTSSTVQY